MRLVHPFLVSPRPLVFAHRGGGALAPENTIAAFDRGLGLGADGLELDVHLSRDGVVVVHHDAVLDRTTDGTGPLAAGSVLELTQLNAGFRFGSGGGYPFRDQGLRIPTLREVLHRYPSTRMIVEIKENSGKMARAVLDDVKAAGALDRVCFGSFGLHVLRALRGSEPMALTSAAREEVRWALYRSWIGRPVARAGYQVYQVPEQAGAVRVVSPRFVRLAHRAGLPVQVWTVDTAADIRRLLDWGVDAVISDRPDVAARAVREWVDSKTSEADRQPER
jgi:glycerophosphoryl diester phosphodiesterase